MLRRTWAFPTDALAQRTAAAVETARRRFHLGQRTDWTGQDDAAMVEDFLELRRRLPASAWVRIGLTAHIDR
jgi:hypothetical protein